VIFFGFFRLGELLGYTLAFDSATCLAWNGVAVEDTSNLSQAKIQQKKSNWGRGLDIFLGYTDTSLCPVATITSYVHEETGAIPWTMSSGRHCLGPFSQSYQGHFSVPGPATDSTSM